MSGLRKFKVYKAAVARVLNPLPVPTICPHCGGKVELVSNSTIYRRECGEWPFAYKCERKECDSYVGLHPKTDIPKGTLANKEMRAARKAAHAVFDPLWQKQGMDRDAAYRWMAEKMGIQEINHAHVAWFDVEQCNKLIEICNTHLKGI